MARKVNPLRLAGLTRNLHRTARSIATAQYAPQLKEIESARQQAILQGKAQEDRARNYGTELQSRYAQVLKDVGAVQVPDNPLAAGGQATQAPMVENWKGYLAAMSQAGGQMGGEQAGQIATAANRSIQDLLTKRQGLVAEREGVAAKTENDLTQQAFTNYATLQGLGIKHDTLAQQLALANINNQYKYDALDQQGRIADRNANLSQQRVNATLRGQDLSHQDRLASIAARNGGVKGLSPTQRRALQKANQKIRAGIQSGADDLVPFLLSYKDKDGNKAYVDKDGSPNWKNIRYALNKRLGNDGDVVNAVVNLYSNGGYLSPKYIHALKARHIGVPKSWYPPGFDGGSRKSNGGGAKNYNGHY